MQPSSSFQNPKGCSLLSCLFFLFIWTTILHGPLSSVSGQSAERVTLQREAGADISCFSQDHGCTYDIFLAEDGDVINDDSVRQAVKQLGSSNCGQANRTIFLDDQAQDDYSVKLDSMEKSFTFVKDEHESRLKELEGTLQTLIDTSDDPSEPDEVSPNVPSSTTKEDDAGGGNSELEDLKRLMQELREITMELQDVREQLDYTNSRMRAEQAKKANKSRQLQEAESEIKMLSRERSELRYLLHDRTKQLDSDSIKVKTCEGDSVKQVEKIDDLFRYSNTLLEDKQTAVYLLNQSRSENRALEAKQAALRATRAKVRREMKMLREDINSCYRAETSKYCSFEDPDMCGFTNEDSDKFDWVLNRGPTPTVRTGPPSDHTCGNKRGQYLLADASQRNCRDKAILWSPFFHGKTMQCIEFWYHMYGDDMGTLWLYAKARGARPAVGIYRPKLGFYNHIFPDSSFGLSEPWAGQGGKDEKYWRKAQVNISKAFAMKGYRFRFTALIKNQRKFYRGDMAIDDLSVTDGPCVRDTTWHLTMGMRKVIAYPTMPTLADRKERLHYMWWELDRRKKATKMRQRRKKVTITRARSYRRVLRRSFRQ